jgi:hypothetical protein
MTLKWMRAMNKKFRGAIFVLICGLFLFQAVNRGAKKLAEPSKPATPAAKAARPGAKTASVANTPIIHATFRPLRYSLLRGGFNSVDEFFERVHEDPVLHDFYGDCADRNAAMHALPEDIVTFSTFRKGNEIKWAQKPVVVKKGEYVMTFCGKTVLARCGNLVSVSPMQPSEDVPPALLEDPEEVVATPLTLASNSEVVPAALPPAAAGAPVSPAIVAAAHHPFWFIPPFYVPPGKSHGGPTLGTSPPIVMPTMPGTPPSTPPPPSGGPLSGDEFDGHQAFITVFIGLIVIGVLKLTTR